MLRCPVCLDDTLQSPDDPNVPPEIVTTQCGHIFHRECIVASFLGRRGGRCPSCRQDVYVELLTRIYLEYSTEVMNMQRLVSQQAEELEESQGVARALQEEKEQLGTEKFELEQRLANIMRNPPSLTFGLAASGEQAAGNEGSNAACLNCDSNLHQTVVCPNKPYLRVIGKSEGGGGAVEGHRMLMCCIFPDADQPAGEIIRDFQILFKMQFNRIQLQALYANFFFDSCCWNCASPLHLAKDCVNPAAEESVRKEIRKVAKLMYLHNNPQKRKERQTKYVNYKNRHLRKAAVAINSGSSADWDDWELV